MFLKAPSFTHVSLPGWGLAVGQEAKAMEVRAATELMGRQDGSWLAR